MFRSSLKPSSGVHGRTSLGYRIGMLIYICYKECRYVAICQFSPSVCVCVGVCVCVCVGMCVCVCQSMTQSRPDRYPDTHTHTHTHTDGLNLHTATYPHYFNKYKSTFQLSNLAKYGYGPPEDGFKGDRNMYGRILSVLV
jgi:hypothetical protein